MRDRFVLVAKMAALLGGVVGVAGMLILNLFFALGGAVVFLAAIAFLDRDTRMGRG